MWLWKLYGNPPNRGNECRDAAKWPVTRSHHIGIGEGANGLGARGTCCNNLYPCFHWDMEEEALFWSLDSGTPHACSEHNHVSEAVGSKTSPGFCLLPEQGTQSLSFALCRNWLNSTFFCCSFFKLCSVLRISTLSAIADSRCELCPFSPFWNLQPHQTKTYWESF